MNQGVNQLTPDMAHVGKLSSQSALIKDQLPGVKGLDVAMQAMAGKEQLNGDVKGLSIAEEVLANRLNLGQQSGKDSNSSANQRGYAQLLSQSGYELTEVAKGTKVAFQELMGKQLATQVAKSTPQDMSASLSSLSNGLLSAGSSSTTASQALTMATPSSTVSVPVNQPGWSQNIGERLQWMVKQNVQEAEIKLNPRHLGPIEIKIAINQEQQAAVSFVANHAVTRDALDAAIPRLREMMSEAGFEQLDVNVSQQQHQEARQQTGDDNNSAHGRSDFSDTTGGMAGDVTHEEDAMLVSQQTAYGGISLLDTYA
ncbi:MAG: flagellar hook-length control protein FliK [Gammaproteobacteria bacterium]|nr:flagellar hook-length control protein FliK [Gammaproteobacteria bacterium]